MIPRPELEGDIQKDICQYLTIKKAFFWRNNTQPVFARNGAGKMMFRSMGKYAMAGLPDIIIIDNGRFIGIEVKRAGINVLRPAQEKFKELCDIHNASYMVVHSVTELVDKLAKYGIYL